MEMSDLWADLTNQLTGDLTPQSSGVLPGAAFSNGDSGGGRDRGDSEKTPGLPVKPEAASVKDIPVEFAAAEDEADEDNEAGTAP